MKLKKLIKKTSVLEYIVIKSNCGEVLYSGVLKEIMQTGDLKQYLDTKVTIIYLFEGVMTIRIDTN